MERKTLRNIMFILFLILVMLVGIRLGYDYIQNKRMKGADIENAKPPKETVPEVAPVIEEASSESSEPVETPLTETVEPEKIERYVTGEHKVKKDESFSLITGFYWDDIFLWPDLYIRNSMRSDDPDLIYPDEIITIYNRLGKGDLSR